MRLRAQRWRAQRRDVILRRGSAVYHAWEIFFAQQLRHSTPNGVVTQKRVANAPYPQYNPSGSVHIVMLNMI